MGIKGLKFDNPLATPLFYANATHVFTHYMYVRKIIHVAAAGCVLTSIGLRH